MSFLLRGYFFVHVTRYFLEPPGRHFKRKSASVVLLKEGETAITESSHTTSESPHARLQRVLTHGFRESSAIASVLSNSPKKMVTFVEKNILEVGQVLFRNVQNISLRDIYQVRDVVESSVFERFFCTREKNKIHT